MAGLIAAGWYYRSHQSKPLTEKDTIVIADFDNQTGDAVFDDTLKTALTVALNQSPFLNVLSDNKVAATLKLMTRPVNTKVDARRCPGTLPAGEQPGIYRRIDREPGQRVRARAEGGELPERRTAGAGAGDGRGKEKVLNALGDAAAKLRGQLGESLATVQKFDVPLRAGNDLFAGSPAGLQHGMKIGREKGADAALVYHQRAIQLDPNFATGYYTVAADYASLGEVGRASEYLTKAFELREHASERERLVITS